MISRSLAFREPTCRHEDSSLKERTDVSVVPTRLPVARLVVLAPSPVRPAAGGCHTVLEWLVDSREDTRASGDPPPPSEDH